MLCSGMQGPVMRARRGEAIEVVVKNNLRYEANFALTGARASAIAICRGAHATAHRIYFPALRPPRVRCMASTPRM